MTENSSDETIDPETRARRDRRLYEFLRTAFSADELRRVLDLHLGRPKSSDLPGPTASLSLVAHEFVRLVNRHGSVTQVLSRLA